MFFFFNDTATTEIYTLSLHDALSDLRSLTGDDARARRAWRLIARQVDTIVVNAEALRREGEAHGMAARWALIPSGVDVARFGNGPSLAEAKRALGLDQIGRASCRERG